MFHSFLLSSLSCSLGSQGKQSYLQCVAGRPRDRTRACHLQDKQRNTPDSVALTQATGLRCYSNHNISSWWWWSLLSVVRFIFCLISLAVWFILS